MLILHPRMEYEKLRILQRYPQLLLFILALQKVGRLHVSGA